ncbi:MAG: peptidoglycan-binding protein [Saprospiraceae bacterium]|nr:peptidoglycan-binding protein [Saprospiraceae bacterium]
MQTLHLGLVDTDAKPSDISAWLQPYHRAMSADLKRLNQFRDESNNKWQPLTTIVGHSVASLQAFLKEAGFFPKAEVSGIFGYGTRAALRLFQEYLRNKEGHNEVIPDGVMGSVSAPPMERWKKTNFIVDGAIFH